MRELTVNLGASYPIFINSNLLDRPFFAEFCHSLNCRLVIVTDSDVLNLHAYAVQDYLKQYGLKTELIHFPAGEANKTRETKQQLEDQLLAKHYGRDTCLIAIGGGVVSDIVGFIAATYCRGIAAIYYPTTLLAMVDASIGGKTAVNTPHGKNLIGSFHQPIAVFINLNTLSTLAQTEWNNGIVEIIKHSLIADSELFYLLKNHPNHKAINSHILTELIYRSCAIKKHLVEQDERDTHLRQLLNFGHTVGHAIEIIENYQIRHGEAVAIGLIVEAMLAVKCGHLSEEKLTEIIAILQQYQLPLQTQAFRSKEVFYQAMALDKKSVASIPQFVLLNEIGKTYSSQHQYVHPVPQEILEQTLDWAALIFDSDRCQAT